MVHSDEPIKPVEFRHKGIQLKNPKSLALTWCLHLTSDPLAQGDQAVALVGGCSVTAFKMSLTVSQALVPPLPRERRRGGGVCALGPVGPARLASALPLVTQTGCLAPLPITGASVASPSQRAPQRGRPGRGPAPGRRGRSRHPARWPEGAPRTRAPGSRVGAGPPRSHSTPCPVAGCLCRAREASGRDPAPRAMGGGQARDGRAPGERLSHLSGFGRLRPRARTGHGCGGRGGSHGRKNEGKNRDLSALAAASRLAAGRPGGWAADARDHTRCWPKQGDACLGVRH